MVAAWTALTPYQVPKVSGYPMEKSPVVAVPLPVRNAPLSDYLLVLVVLPLGHPVEPTLE
jgi:hypothetical protein